MSNKKIVFDNFLTICERLKKELSIKTDKQLLEIIDTTQPTFSRRKIENNFSIEWAYSISIKKDLQIKWIMTGEGLKRIGERKAIRKIALLDEIESWLNELMEKDPSREAWFGHQFRDSFKSFAKWEEKKNMLEGDGDNYPSSKVA